MDTKEIFEDKEFMELGSFRFPIGIGFRDPRYWLMRTDNDDSWTESTQFGEIREGFLRTKPENYTSLKRFLGTAKLSRNPVAERRTVDFTGTESSLWRSQYNLCSLEYYSRYSAAAKQGFKFSSATIRRAVLSPLSLFFELVWRSYFPNLIKFPTPY